MDLPDDRSLTGGAGSPQSRPADPAGPPPAARPLFETGHPEDRDHPVPPSTPTLPPFTDC